MLGPLANFGAAAEFVNGRSHITSRAQTAHARTCAECNGKNNGSNNCWLQEQRPRWRGRVVLMQAMTTIITTTIINASLSVWRQRCVTITITITTIAVVIHAKAVPVVSGCCALRLKHQVWPECDWAGRM